MRNSSKYKYFNKNKYTKMWIFPIFDLFCFNQNKNKTPFNIFSNKFSFIIYLLLVGLFKYLPDALISLY